MRLDGPGRCARIGPAGAPGSARPMRPDGPGRCGWQSTLADRRSHPDDVRPRPVAVSHGDGLKTDVRAPRSRPRWPNVDPQAHRSRDDRRPGEQARERRPGDRRATGRPGERPGEGRPSDRASSERAGDRATGRPSGRATGRAAPSPARGSGKRVTRAAFAATIGPCPCGAVRIAGHPRPRRPGVGCAVDPAPRALPARTSGARSPRRSDIAVSTASDGHSGATRSGAVGRPRPSPSRPPRPASSVPVRRPSMHTNLEPLFESSSSSRCRRGHRDEAG